MHSYINVFCLFVSDDTYSDNVIDNSSPSKQLPKTMAAPSNAGRYAPTCTTCCKVFCYATSSDKRYRPSLPLQMCKIGDCKLFVMC